VNNFLILLLIIVNSLFCTSFATELESELVNNQHTKNDIKICAVYPHLKDSYWLSINFGMTEQAKQRTIELKVL